MVEATYVDFDSSFEPHPVTGDLTLLRDEEAVKASIRNLVLTKFYERPFQPRLGSRVKESLFEHLVPATLEILKQDIELVIENSEPRCRLLGVQIKTTSVTSIEITIVFVLLNNSREVQTTIILDRIR
jgi:phage baseplate assembly protein W